MNCTARRRPLLLGASATALTLLATACSGQTVQLQAGPGTAGGNSKTIRIALTTGYDEDIAATYLWKEILEERGYQVVVQELEVANAYAGSANQQIDLYLDSWLPAAHGPYWKKYGAKLEKISTWYQPADLNVTVPTYMRDVDSLADLKTHASEFGGQIYGIEPGTGLMRLTRTKAMPTYGLTGAYRLTESSTPAMLSALQTAIEQRKPIAVTLWRPHWAYTKLPLKPLKDPRRAYGKPDTIQTVARKGFTKDHARVAGWLKNFHLTSDQLGKLELLIRKKGTGKEQQAAKEWMKANKKLVASWTKD